MRILILVATCLLLWDSATFSQTTEKFCFFCRDGGGNFFHGELTDSSSAIAQKKQVMSNETGDVSCRVIPETQLLFLQIFDEAKIYSLNNWDSLSSELPIVLPDSSWSLSKKIGEIIYERGGNNESSLPKWFAISDGVAKLFWTSNVGYLWLRYPMDTPAQSFKWDLNWGWVPNPEYPNWKSFGPEELARQRTFISTLKK